MAGLLAAALAYGGLLLASTVWGIPTQTMDTRHIDNSTCSSASSWFKGGSSNSAFAFSTTSSGAACCSECVANAVCDYFTFSSVSHTQNCHLKTGYPTFNNKQGCVTSVPHGPAPRPSPPTPHPPTPTPPPPPTPKPVPPAKNSPNVLLLFPGERVAAWDGRGVVAMSMLRVGVPLCVAVASLWGTLLLFGRHVPAPNE